MQPQPPPPEPPPLPPFLVAAADDDEAEERGEERKETVRRPRAEIDGRQRCGRRRSAWRSRCRSDRRRRSGGGRLRRDDMRRDRGDSHRGFVSGRRAVMRSRKIERLPHATGKKIRRRSAGPPTSYSKPYVATGISTSRITCTWPPEYHAMAFSRCGTRPQSGRCVCVATRKARYSAPVIPTISAAVANRSSFRAMLICSSANVVLGPRSGALPSSAMTVGAERQGEAVIATMRLRAMQRRKSPSDRHHILEFDGAEPGHSWT